MLLGLSCSILILLEPNAVLPRSIAVILEALEAHAAVVAENRVLRDLSADVARRHVKLWLARLFLRSHFSRLDETHVVALSLL